MGKKGGGGSGGGSTTTVQQADPWAGQQPYLKDVFTGAQKLYKGGQLAPEYYPGQTVAGQDPYTAQAIQQQAQRSLAGSSAVKSAQNQLDQTMKGQYLNNNPFLQNSGNPYLDEMVGRAQDQTLTAVNGNFAQAGRYGSGAHAAAANDAAGGIATQMYGQAYDQDQNRALSAYNTERENQMRGMMFAPSLAAEDYKDIAALSEAGTAKENYAQDAINAKIDKYNYSAGRPLSALQNYASLVQGNYGMSGTSTASAAAGRSNRLGGALGGALSGAGTGALIGGWPGALIGGAAGGLLSLF